MAPKIASNNDRHAILTRVQAATHKEALAAMMEHARALGYEPIMASCRPIHLPLTWEGTIEIKSPQP